MRVMAKKAKKTDEPVQPMSIRLDAKIAAALEVFIKRQKYRTTKTDVIEVALQELLKAEGCWPIDDDGK